jgi:hypothetical protein
VAALVATLALAGCQPHTTEATRLGELRLRVLPSTDAPLLEQSYDFKTVKVGQTAVITVEATNVGRDPLELLAVNLLAADTGAFFVRAAAAHLEPGATSTCEVTFAPVRDGAQTARLVFDHDSNAPKPVLSLTGSGAP